MVQHLLTTGQGCFGLINLGVQSKFYLNSNSRVLANVSNAGDIIYVISLLVGIMIWGFGCFWLYHGTSAILTVIIQDKKLAINMGLWGLIFPIGVFTAGTAAIGKNLPSNFFTYFSYILLIILIALYLTVFVVTIYGVINGTLISAPCAALIMEHNKSIDHQNKANIELEVLDEIDYESNNQDGDIGITNGSQEVKTS